MSISGRETCCPTAFRRAIEPVERTRVVIIDQGPDPALPTSEGRVLPTAYESLLSGRPDPVLSFDTAATVTGLHNAR